MNQSSKIVLSVIAFIAFNVPLHLCSLTSNIPKPSQTLTQARARFVETQTVVSETDSQTWTQGKPPKCRKAALRKLKSISFFPIISTNKDNIPNPRSGLRRYPVLSESKVLLQCNDNAAKKELDKLFNQWTKEFNREVDKAIESPNVTIT